MGVISRANLFARAIVASGLRPTSWGQGLLGSNTTQPASFSTAYFMTNAAQAGTPPTDLAGNPIATANIGTFGWPTVAFMFFLTKPNGGVGDGQLPHGTYQCSYKLLTANPSWTPGTVPTVAPVSGSCTITNLVLQPDNITVNFTLVTPATTNVQIQFSGGVQYPFVPRDGTSTWDGSEFSADMLQSFSQHNGLRMMDLNNTIPPNSAATAIIVGRDYVISNPGSTDFTTCGAADSRAGTIFTATSVPTGSGQVQLSDITWNNRVKDYGVPSPGFPWSLERQIRFINAVKAVPGSQTKNHWFNLNPYITTNYAFNAATMLNSLFTAGVPLFIELANEPWNTGSTIYGIYSAFAQQELNCINSRNIGSTFIQLITPPNIAAVNIVAGYSCTIASVGTTDFTLIGAASNTPGVVFTATGPGTGTGTVQVLGSITGDGTTTTVTLSQAVSVPSWLINGAQFIPSNTTVPAWSKDAGGNLYSPTNLATVLSVTGRSFTYASQGNGTMALSNGWVAYFNPTSNLITDGNLDINQLPFKWYIRQLYLTWQQFQLAGRTQDRFIFNHQMPLNINQLSAGSAPAIHYTYATYIANWYVPGTSITTWLYGSSIAPYIKAQSRYSSASTSTPNQIFGVPFAAYAQAGDSITISGAGASGASLVTTVAAGSSGTTLNINGTVLTNVTGGTGTTSAPPSIVYTDGDSTAILQCMLLGYMPWIEVYIRNHAYFCKKFGLHMLAYEIGTDTQAIPNQQVNMNSNPVMTQVIRGLLETWFGAGGEEAYMFSCVPGTVTNVSLGGWNWMSTWPDATSPKVAGLLMYRKFVKFFQNVFSPAPGAAPVVTYAKLTGVGNVNSDQSVMAGKDSAGNNPTCNFVNGMCYFTDNTGARFADQLVVFPQTAQYSAVFSGSDSTAGTIALIFLDGVQIGTATLPANGSGSNNATVPGSVNVLNLSAGTKLAITAGKHLLSVQFTGSAPNKGTVPGTSSITFTAL